MAKLMKPPENVFRVGEHGKSSDLLYLPGFERVNPETGGSKPRPSPGEAPDCFCPIKCQQLLPPCSLQTVG